jgi:hypothetical protein
MGVYTNVRLLHTDDQAYVAAYMALYTFPETTSGFLILGLPVLPKFFREIQKSSAARTMKSSDGTPGSSGARRSPMQKRSWWFISSMGSTFNRTAASVDEIEFNTTGMTGESKDGEDAAIAEIISFQQTDLDLELHHEARHR